MTDPGLYEQIRSVRQELREIDGLGELHSERYLIADGQLVGQEYCFESATAKWLFGQKQVQLIDAAGTIQQISVRPEAIDGPSVVPTLPMPTRSGRNEDLPDVLESEKTDFNSSESETTVGSSHQNRAA